MTGLSRRELLSSSAGGAVAVGLGLAAAAAPAVSTASTPGPDVAPTLEDPPGLLVEPFYGTHQSGIATAHQAHAVFLGLDLLPATDRAAAVRMLRLLTDDAARLTQGRPALGDTEPELAREPARLTVTFGLGPSAFDRLGLAELRPGGVAALPAFPTDRLSERWGQTDLLLQVCTDSPLTLAHTARMLIKDSRAFASLRWAQRGFSTVGPATPRNLMGQVDGTVNPVPGTPAFDAAVWAGGGGRPEPGWFAGGTVLVLRRIRMDLDAWDAFERPGKEQVIGRRLDNGAPLTGTREHDTPDLDALDDAGFPVIEPNAHIRLAAARDGETILRRPYSYEVGPDADGGTEAGLLFAAYQGDPRTSFVPVQTRLAASDLFNRWITHVGSAVYAIAPGVTEGEYWGQGLLGR